MTDDRMPVAQPAFRHSGPGSLVTRNCMPCGKWKITTGGTGSGLRWRCASCSPCRTAAQP